MTPETLALLTARSTNLNRVTRGGKPALTSSDVAAALSGISSPATDYALYRYVGDTSAQPRLFYIAYLRAVDVANRDGWQPPKGSEIIRKMTKAALVETFDCPVCRSCGGTGYLGAKSCTQCGGGGTARIPDSTIAHALGVDKSNYSRTWRDRYQSVRRDIGGWVCNLDGEVRYKIKNW